MCVFMRYKKCSNKNSGKLNSSKLTKLNEDRLFLRFHLSRDKVKNQFELHIICGEKHHTIIPKIDVEKSEYENEKMVQQEMVI